ncbi:hypothetical protein [Aeromonas phage AerS_266]|nr:hypothetical protein [Aeromonas phage AerS_266]
MFDNQPLATSLSSPLAAANIQDQNNVIRKVIHYIDNIFNPDIHDIKDIAKYVVPNEGELVFDVVNRQILQAAHVDKYGTWKTTLEPWSLIEQDTGNDYDLFPQHEYGFLQGELALAVDYSVRPPVARVDSNAVAPDAAYAILYKGSVIGDKGQVISARYSGQELIDNVISVSPVVYDNLENRTVMGADTFSININENEFPNGSRAALVYYDINGRPIPPVYFVAAQHCAYLRDHQLGKRYIKSIELISPWFTNSTSPRTLFIPINTALKTIQFSAKVHYSDGTSSEELPVNTYNGNNGFTLIGIDQYKPTVPGQTSDALVLTYAFKEHEQAYIVQPGAPRHISEQYTIVATPAEGAYSPRLYTYPYWDPSLGWVLRHYLTDLDRRFCREVTSAVKLNESSPAFDGSRYGSEQNLIFNLNLRDVNASYAPWTFTQETSITLYNNGTVEGRKWDVRHSYGKPAFSALNLEFNSGVGGITTGKFAGYTTVEEFLEKAYYAFEPIFDPRTEINPPVPTHFDILRTNNTARTGIPVVDYNNLPISDLALINGEGVYVRWVKREANGNELQLGVSAGVCKLAVS